jgi:putative NADH-flavin reductase
MKLFLIFLLYAIALSIGLWRKGVRWSGVGAIPTIHDRLIARVLIVGATGGTGRQLVLQALERGYQVTALVRDPGKLQLEHPKLRVVRGDVLQYSSLEEAVRGQDAVLSALGHKRFFGPTRILSEGTRNLLRAMEAHGVRRLVSETALGLGNSAARMGLYYTLLVIPLIVPFYFWDKTRQERLIASSPMDWVIVRPGALTNGPRRGTYRHGGHLGNLIWTVRISRADVADFMLNQLTDNAYLKRAPAVCW